MAVNNELMNIVEIIKQAIPAEQIYLFGSQAYGHANDSSDFDLFVVIPDGDIPPLDATILARRALSRIRRNTPVDIIADCRSRFDDRKQLNTLERKVFTDGALIYERT